MTVICFFLYKTSVFVLKPLGSGDDGSQESHLVLITLGAPLQGRMRQRFQAGQEVINQAHFTRPTTRTVLKQFKEAPTAI
jgi:hypothetical protein